MYQPIFFRFVVGASCAWSALSLFYATGAFIQTTNALQNSAKQYERDVQRIADAVERGMNKYAPPKKEMK